MRQYNNQSAFAGVTFSSIFFALLTYAVLRWMDIPVGHFSDWIIGVITFGWLMTIVTVPWNIYFEAKFVVLESAKSKEREINIKPKEIEYARKVASRALIVALFLHIATTVGLYWLSHAEISIIGYFGAIASLALTFVRPAIRAYQYIADRLRGIHQEIFYPREDIVTLRSDIEYLKGVLNESDEYSWYNQQQDKQIEFNRKLASIEEQLSELIKQNQKEHRELTQATQHAVSQLNEEGKFMEHIAEIIRFVKKY